MDSSDWNQMIEFFEMNQTDDDSFDSLDWDQMIEIFEMNRTDDDSFDYSDRNLLNRNDFFDAF